MKCPSSSSSRHPPSSNALTCASSRRLGRSAHLQRRPPGTCRRQSASVHGGGASTYVQAFGIDVAVTVQRVHPAATSSASTAPSSRCKCLVRPRHHRRARARRARMRASANYSPLARPTTGRACTTRPPGCTCPAVVASRSFRRRVLTRRAATWSCVLLRARRPLYSPSSSSSSSRSALRLASTPLNVHWCDFLCASNSLARSIRSYSSSGPSSMMSSPSSSVPPPAAEDPGSESARGPARRGRRARRRPSRRRRWTPTRRLSSRISTRRPRPRPARRPGGPAPLDAPEPLRDVVHRDVGFRLDRVLEEGRAGGLATACRARRSSSWPARGVGRKDAVIDGGGGRIISASREKRP